jgi:hypothetical protein
MTKLAFILLFICIGADSIAQKSKRNSNNYINIFNGKNLDGWEGDSVYWRVENGTLVGEVTPATILKRNSFIIWKGGITKDFELIVDYRISAHGNSGINYRSIILDTLKYAMKGYQADIDGANRYSGQNYEERGRTFLAMRGQRVAIGTDHKPVITDSLGSKDSLATFIKIEDWNEYRLVVKGNNMRHYINGILMSEVTDNDTETRTMSGSLGVQVHVGPPMKIEYRNFRLKEL